MGKKVTAPPDPRIAQAVDWMVQELASKGGNNLSQYSVARHVRENVGADLVYRNSNGNWALDPRINDLFRQRTPDVVWIRSDQSWRQRRPKDKPGRMQP